MYVLQRHFATTTSYIFVKIQNERLVVFTSFLVISDWWAYRYYHVSLYLGNVDSLAGGAEVAVSGPFRDNVTLALRFCLSRLGRFVWCFNFEPVESEKQKSVSDSHSNREVPGEQRLCAGRVQKDAIGMA